MRKTIGLLLVAASLAFGLAPGDCEAANLSRLLGAQRPVARASAELTSPTATSLRTARGERTTPGSQAQLRATPRFPILRLILLYLLWNGYN